MIGYGRMAFASLTLIALIALPTLSPAAEIQLSNRERCDVLLQGDIAKGDLARLRKIKAKSQLRLFGQLCLDSNGGDLDEAVAIAEHMVLDDDNKRVSFKTFVDEGHSCLGVCALLFMFGSEYEGHDLFARKRTFHVGGTLGFFAPGSAIHGSLSGSFQKGLFEMGRFLKADRKNMLPTPLIIEMLKSDPSKPIELRTVRDALRWYVDLVGYTAPVSVNALMLEQACRSKITWSKMAVARWQEGRQLPSVDLASSKAPPELKMINQRYRAKVNSETGFCLVDVSIEPEAGLHLRVSVFDPSQSSTPPEKLLKSSEAFADRDNADPLWLLLPPQRLLKTSP